MRRAAKKILVEEDSVKSDLKRLDRLMERMGNVNAESDKRFSRLSDDVNFLRKAIEFTVLNICRYAHDALGKRICNRMQRIFDTEGEISPETLQEVKVFRSRFEIFPSTPVKGSGHDFQASPVVDLNRVQLTQ